VKKPFAHSTTHEDVLSGFSGSEEFIGKLREQLDQDPQNPERSKLLMRALMMRAKALNPENDLQELQHIHDEVITTSRELRRKGYTDFETDLIAVKAMQDRSLVSSEGDNPEEVVKRMVGAFRIILSLSDSYPAAPSVRLILNEIARNVVEAMNNAGMLDLNSETPVANEWVYSFSLHHDVHEQELLTNLSRMIPVLKDLGLFTEYAMCINRMRNIKEDKLTHVIPEPVLHENDQLERFRKAHKNGENTTGFIKQYLNVLSQEVHWCLQHNFLKKAWELYSEEHSLRIYLFSENERHVEYLQNLVDLQLNMLRFEKKFNPTAYDDFADLTLALIARYMESETKVTPVYYEALLDLCSDLSGSRGMNDWYRNHMITCLKALISNRVQHQQREQAIVYFRRLEALTQYNPYVYKTTAESEKRSFTLMIIQKLLKQQELFRRQNKRRRQKICLDRSLIMIRKLVKQQPGNVETQNTLRKVLNELAHYHFQTGHAETADLFVKQYVDALQNKF
jgi:hypothetical protein